MQNFVTGRTFPRLYLPKAAASNGLGVAYLGNWSEAEDAFGVGEFEAVGGFLEAASGGVEAEDGDDGGVLAGGKEEMAGGVDLEVARGFAAGGDVLQEGGASSLFVAGEDSDAVVAAVGAVNPFARGMDGDFGGGAVAGEGGGKEGDGLDGGEVAVGGVVIEGGEGGGHFAEEIGKAAIGMEGEMARAGAGLAFVEGRIIGSDDTGGGVEVVDEDFVEAEVAIEDVLAGQVGDNAMGVRAFLTLMVGAGTVVLDEIGAGFEGAVRLGGENGHAAAAVVGGENPPAGGIDGDVARTVAAGELAIEEGEHTIGADGKSTDGAAIGALFFAD